MVQQTLDVPEQIQEAKRFDNHPNKRPFAEHQKNASEETYGSANLLLASEKVECLLRTNDERQA